MKMKYNIFHLYTARISKIQPSGHICPVDLLIQSLWSELTHMFLEWLQVQGSGCVPHAVPAPASSWSLHVVPTLGLMLHMMPIPANLESALQEVPTPLAWSRTECCGHSRVFQWTAFNLLVGKWVPFSFLAILEFSALSDSIPPASKHFSVVSLIT